MRLTEVVEGKEQPREADRSDGDEKQEVGDHGSEGPRIM